MLNQRRVALHGRGTKRDETLMGTGARLPTEAVKRVRELSRARIDAASSALDLGRAGDALHSFAVIRCDDFCAGQ